MKSITTAAHRTGFEFPSNELEYIGIHEDGDYSNKAIITDKIERAFGDRKNAPTAMIALSDYMAVKFIDALKNIAPLSAEMEVIGRHDTMWSRVAGREFSSFRVDYAEMWAKAFDLFEGNNINENSTIQWIIPKLICR